VAGREHAEYALADSTCLLCCTHRACGDFMAFEEHVATPQTAWLDVPKEWYEAPFFYFSKPDAIFGPRGCDPVPEGTRELDYELECAR